MKTIKASAPGKCIIIGEHAVVYNKPAIIAAVGLRTNVQAEKSDNVIFNSKTFSFNQTWSVDDTLSCANKTMKLWQDCYKRKEFSELFDYIKKDGYGIYKKATVGIVLNRLEISGGVDIKVEAEMPPGSGLGSSSAYAVAATKAIAELYGKRLTLEKINEIAYDMEKIVHGTPSGGDNSACCFGGLILFRKEPLTIKSLKKDIPYELKNFVLVNTGHPEKTTGELVQMVRNLDEKYRNKRIDEIGLMTNDMVEALKKKDFEKMRDIINKTQKNLAELGLSTQAINKIHKEVMTIGGASKLCGAGGGGIMLCWHEDKKKLLNKIRELGYEPIETNLAVEGVRID